MFFCYNTYAQDCSILDPNEFGDCENFIGYVWSGELCAPVYGCNTNNDDEYFFNNYEFI